ncbi:hypothetical protein HY612_02485 [Candidatus Roizmanbacteria bacterium]|nr:hypothetical protein [Candidatus Roizmanbacteria bacterium]
METLDLTDRTNWNIKKAEAIALLFRYEAGDGFNAALQGFIVGFVKEARITSQLQSLAVKHFRDWTPPLPRIQSNQTPSNT